MKSLVLAEKPSVAREIARVLQCSKKSKGYIEGPRYVVTWALGHLVTLAEPDDYDKRLKQWRIEDLPMLPEKMKLKVIKQTSHQFQVVKELMKRNDIEELVIATDAGREGELVARWIMEMVRWRKPFKRLWISSQTDNAIREGFARLQPGTQYNSLYAAAACRAEADWLIGLNVTRSLSCKFNAQLNAGRVQTPTLAMIVKREKEIKAFVPRDYWTIRADFGDYYGDWRGKDGGRIFDYARAEEILSRIKGRMAAIKEVKTEARSEAPPLAYDLTELQREANRRLGWSAQKTLSILQELYEVHKLVTYPRTDSRYITDDIVPTLPLRLKSMGVGPYADLAHPLLQKPLKPGKRLVDNSKVSDHHAIIPTEQPLQLKSLNEEERRLYDLIARRFLAVLYPPYRYEQTTIITVVEGENFHSRGKVEIDRGWRAVQAVPSDKDEKDEEQLPEQTLARHKKGETLEVKSGKASKHKTKAPARYTEATLLTAMENCGKLVEDKKLRESIKGSGLGTPATRAEIIEKLIRTSYIERQRKELVPTSKGIQLMDLAPPDLRSPELTAQWEQRLAEIARGQGKRLDFMADIRRDTVQLVQNIKSDSSSTYRADNVSKSKCPQCGRFMLLVNGRKGKILACPERSCGYRQPEAEDFSGKGGNSRANRRLMAKYSNQEELETNLGELLKAALAKKEQG
ncbi:DNA topoisomerase III [Syntrophomonas wolfei]|uniref:DNA topoisomerase n=1 Tax=Syntrophomonas wolfei subsp. wolfei (strain DSM 2245B / Goettingen) TaxID=335541 RepID=Q0AZM3_SYNWW|nr:DNA topoisomerase III [Syntrophomonas wolfei]ABI67831.1 DNA topoisomerase [Syntrophomonas wolfei subsp. wolfei str. Goettingen G311]